MMFWVEYLVCVNLEGSDQGKQHFKFGVSPVILYVDDCTYINVHCIRDIVLCSVQLISSALHSIT